MTNSAKYTVLVARPFTPEEVGHRWDKGIKIHHFVLHVFPSREAGEAWLDNNLETVRRLGKGMNATIGLRTWRFPK